MRTKTVITLATATAVIGSASANQPVMASVFLVGGALVFLLHAIEVKINRLLDERGIVVTKEEIAA